MLLDVGVFLDLYKTEQVNLGRSVAPNAEFIPPPAPTHPPIPSTSTLDYIFNLDQDLGYPQT